jgi:subtilase family serine protease
VRASDRPNKNFSVARAEKARAAPPRSGATINDPISVYIEITNRGVLPVVFKQGDAYVQISLPGRSTPWKWTAGMDLTVTPSRPLTSGQTVFPPGQVPPGTYSLTAIADPDNRVTESDETNNQAALNWTIVTAGKPDLVISDVYTQQVQVGGDLCLNIVVTVKNAGPGNAFVSYKTNILNCAELGISKSPQTSTNYKPGDSERFVFTLLNFVGPRTLVFTIDPDNAVKEADETNNSRAFLAEVK